MRQTVYKEVLKEASAARRKENIKNDKGDKNDNGNTTEDNQKSAEEKHESKRPAMAKYSPLDPEVLDLMYGQRDRKAENNMDDTKKVETAKKRGTP